MKRSSKITLVVLIAVVLIIAGKIAFKGSNNDEAAPKDRPTLTSTPWP